MLFLYLACLIIASYWVIKTLGPEMAKPSLPKEPLKQKPLEAPMPIDFSQSNAPDFRINKLEVILEEKNKTINFLEKELKVFQVQVNAFDKVKTLMDEEIHRLREQNRIFRSELGLPAVQTREHSIK